MSLIYIRGGKIREHKVTDEPPIRLTIRPKSGMAKHINTSKNTIEVRRTHLLKLKSAKYKLTLIDLNRNSKFFS